MIKKKTFLMLGKYGEICNILPMLWYIARTETRPTLIVSKIYSDILDGVSYVDKVVFPYGPQHLSEAQEFAHGIDPDFIPIMAKGVLFQHRLTNNYLLEPWARAGYLDYYGLPLIFDRRDHEREVELVKKVNDLGKPIILISNWSVDAPIAHPEQLITKIKSRFPEANVIDLREVRAEKFHDLLGLIQASQVLVTVDNSILQLAEAVATPIIALAQSDRHAWSGEPGGGRDYYAGRDMNSNSPLYWATPKRPSHKYYCLYGTYHSKNASEREKMMMEISNWMEPNVYMPIAKELGLSVKARVKVKVRALGKDELSRLGYLRRKARQGRISEDEVRELARGMKLVQDNKEQRKLQKREIIKR